MPNSLCGHVTTFGCDHGLSCCVQRHRQHGTHRSRHRGHSSNHGRHHRGHPGNYGGHHRGHSIGHHRSSYPNQGHNSYPHGKHRKHSYYKQGRGASRNGQYPSKQRGYGYYDGHSNAHNRGYSRSGYTHGKDSAPYDKDISSSFHEFQSFIKDFDDIEKQIKSYSDSNHHTSVKNVFDSYDTDSSSHDRNSYGLHDRDSSYDHEGYSAENEINTYPDHRVNKRHHSHYDDGFKDIDEVNKMMSDLLLEDESKKP